MRARPIPLSLCPYGMKTPWTANSVSPEAGDAVGAPVVDHTLSSSKLEPELLLDSPGTIAFAVASATHAPVPVSAVAASPPRTRTACSR